MNSKEWETKSSAAQCPTKSEPQKAITIGWVKYEKYEKYRSAFWFGLW